MIRKTSPQDIQPYLTDASNFQGGHAEGVAFPESEKEVVEFIKEAHAHGTPVTIAGNGTGLTGARVPTGGWVLATDRLSKIKRIEKDPVRRSSYAVIEPGCQLKTLQDALGSLALFYPPDPTSFKSFLGGNVATNASGPRSFRYGPTRDFIRRLRIVLADGSLLHLERGKIFANAVGEIEIPASGSKIKIKIPSYAMPPIKHTAGYFAKPKMDAIDLFIGSEGTLGMVTEIEVALVNPPRDYFSYVLFFASEEASWNFAEDARFVSRRHRGERNDAAIQARALEYLDGPSLDFIRAKYPTVPREARAAIYLEQECQPETKDLLIDRWGALFEKHKALVEDVWLGESEEEHEKFRAFRHEVPLEVKAFLAQHGQSKVGTDMAVPEKAFKDLMLFQRKRLNDLGIRNITFGHIGDCHVHLNILAQNGEEHARAWGLYHELIQKALQLGGTIAAEHGVGKLKKCYLVEMFGQKGIEEMAAVKKAFDPKIILGRGNILDM